MRIEPLIDPFTGARLFNIASHNLHDAQIVTRDLQAGFQWMQRVHRAILKSYASLASAVAQNLKDKILRESTSDKVKE